MRAKIKSETVSLKLYPKHQRCVRWGNWWIIRHRNYNQLLKAPTRTRPKLDDLVTVCCEILFFSKKETVFYTKKELSNIILMDQNIRRDILAVEKEQSFGCQSNQNKTFYSQGKPHDSIKKKKKLKKGDKKGGEQSSKGSSSDSRKGNNKSGNFFYDCGATNHDRGDPSCREPSLKPRLIIE